MSPNIKFRNQTIGKTPIHADGTLMEYNAPIATARQAVPQQLLAAGPIA